MSMTVLASSFLPSTYIYFNLIGMHNYVFNGPQVIMKEISPTKSGLR